MSGTASIDINLLHQWMNEKWEVKKVEETLIAKDFKPEIIAVYVREYKRLRIAGRQARGFFFAALGAFLGFLSCLLTVLNPIPELYNYILFGLTSVAILFILFGLYLLFE